MTDIWASTGVFLLAVKLTVPLLQTCTDIQMARSRDSAELGERHALLSAAGGAQITTHLGLHLLGLQQDIPAGIELAPAMLQGQLRTAHRTLVDVMPPFAHHDYVRFVWGVDTASRGLDPHA